MSSLPLNWKNQHHKEDDLIVLSIFSIIRVNFINFLNLFLISKLVCRRILLRTVPVCDIISKKSIQNQTFQISYKFSNPWHYLRIFDKSASFYKLFSVKNQNLSIFHIPYGCQQMKIFAFKCEIQFPFLFRKLFRENEFSRKKQKRCEILWKKKKKICNYFVKNWKNFVFFAKWFRWKPFPVPYIEDFELPNHKFNPSFRVFLIKNNDLIFYTKLM